MSTDPIGAALTLDRPAIRASAPRTASGQSCELTGIAAAIERVEALLASIGPEPEGSDAVERIADIAFVLHERDVEASLCDALDAAVRELANANEAKQTNVRHVRQAAELLRELSQRVGDMIALLQVSPPSEANNPAASIATLEEAEPAFAEHPASADALDGDIPREGLFTAETLEDDEFARAVAELAASLPALAAPVEAVVVTLHQPTDPATDESTTATEREEAVIGAQDESADLAVSEPPVAHELIEAFFETQTQPDEVVTEQPVLPPRLEEAASDTLAEARHDFGELPADKTSLELQPPPMCDAPVAGYALSEELSIADVIDEPIARGDEISRPHSSSEPSKDDAVPGSESPVSEPLSDETLANGADVAAQLADLPSDSSDLSSMNGHPLVSLAVAEPPNIPSEALSPVPPEPAPEGEIALLPENSPFPTLGVQSELPPTGDAPAPPADATISAGTDGDESTQIASKTLPQNADETVPEAATRVEDEPPPRVVNSSQALLPELALVDPQDDPGDLFEPPTGAAPPAAAMTFTGSQSASEISARTAAMRARSPTAATDPVAAMRTLGAEELLALFT